MVRQHGCRFVRLRVEAKKLFKEFNRTEDEETELRQQFSSAFALETIIGQYTFGTPEGSVGPDGYSLDYYYVNLPGRAEMQNDLILDYCSNVALYPEFQKYLRDNLITSHHCWPYGVRMTLRSSLPEPMPSSAMCPMPIFTLSPVVILPSKAIIRKLRG